MNSTNDSSQNGRPAVSDDAVVAPVAKVVAPAQGMDVKPSKGEHTNSADSSLGVGSHAVGPPTSKYPNHLPNGAASSLPAEDPKYLQYLDEAASEVSPKPQETTVATTMPRHNFGHKMLV